MPFFGGIGKGDCSECVHVTSIAVGGGYILPIHELEVLRLFFRIFLSILFAKASLMPFSKIPWKIFKQQQLLKYGGDFYKGK